MKGVDIIIMRGIQTSRKEAGLTTSIIWTLVLHRKKRVSTLEDIAFEELVAVCTSRGGGDGSLRCGTEGCTEGRGRNSDGMRGHAHARVMGVGGESRC